jgi:hypothetical protein
MTTTVTTCKAPKSKRTRAALMNLAQATTRALYKEADVQATCVQALELDGWRRLRTDPVSDRSTVQAIRRAIMGVPALNHVRELLFKLISRCVRGKGFGEVGMADDLFIRYYDPRVDRTAWLEGDGTRWQRAQSQTMWIEWKAPAGTTSPHQLTWHQAEKARGALTVIGGIDFDLSDPVAGFALWYLESGLCRRPEVFRALVPPEGRPNG